MNAHFVHNGTLTPATSGPASARNGDQPKPGFCQLRFSSLFDPGRGVTVPCDAKGEVDLDALTERLRNAYLAARAMIGREYAFPTVEHPH